MKSVPSVGDMEHNSMVAQNVPAAITCKTKKGMSNQLIFRLYFSKGNRTATLNYCTALYLLNCNLFYDLKFQL